MATKLTRIHCTTCGSTDVSCDASARWCDETSQWELSGLFDNTDCDDCGGECRTVEVTCILPDELVQPQGISPLVTFEIEQSEHGEAIDGGPRVMCELFHTHTQARVCLGDNTDYSVPDIMIELQPEGWAVYLHDGAQDDPEKVILPFPGAKLEA
jgi:hypothetical protein